MLRVVIDYGSLQLWTISWIGVRIESLAPKGLPITVNGFPWLLRKRSKGSAILSAELLDVSDDTMYLDGLGYAKTLVKIGKFINVDLIVGLQFWTKAGQSDVVECNESLPKFLELYWKLFNEPISHVEKFLGIWTIQIPTMVFVEFHTI